MIIIYVLFLVIKLKEVCIVSKIEIYLIVYFYVIIFLVLKIFLLSFGILIYNIVLKF